MMSILAKIIAVIAAAVAVLVGVALYVTPWPGALLIRSIFDKGSAEANAALEKFVPQDIQIKQAVQFDPTDPTSLLDIYRPGNGNDSARPVIVWVHGGGFVSGSRGDIANYLKIFSARGFTVVGVDYTIAPEATYPTPVRQVNRALGFLAKKGAELGLNTTKMIIAGDSAGAQIAAQVANLVTSPEYAKDVGIIPEIKPDQMAGTILFCGPFDLALMKSDGGVAGLLVKNFLWSYSGFRDHRQHSGFELMSVVNHVTPAFPPTFLSVGNADPLKAHSVALAEALSANGVKVDTLFYPDDHAPPLAHEYQFNLDSVDGQKALARAVNFASSLMPRA